MPHSLLIKCCPFCGSTKVILQRTNENACWIECYKCGAQIDSVKTKQAAIAKWNRRKFEFDVDERTATIVEDNDKEFKDFHEEV